MFARWLKHQGAPAWLSAYGELAGLYQILLQRGVADRILQKWLTNIQDLMAGTDEPRPVGTAQALRLLMKFIEVINPWQQPDRKEPRVWTFVGPPGVGKSTTIAKLAVQFALKMGKKVGLVSLDCRRWEAADLLALYGKFLGAPFLPVPRPRELREILSKLSGLQVVLVDTPGLPLTSADMLSLMEILTEMPGLEHHLLLSATRSESNLAAALQAMRRFPLKSLIITKVDESLDFAGLFNQLCCHRMPVSYLTTGQGIPEDIETASRPRIVALLLEKQGTAPGIASWDGYEQTVGA